MISLLGLTDEWDDEFNNRSRLTKFIDSFLYVFGHIDAEGSPKARKNRFTGRIEMRFMMHKIWWDWIDLNKKKYGKFIPDEKATS